MRVLVRFKGVIADRVKGSTGNHNYHRIPSAVLAASTLAGYCSQVTVSCKESPEKIRAFLLATEQELKPWYPDCPLNADCRLTNGNLDSLIRKLNLDDIFITSYEREAKIASKRGITVFLISEHKKGHIPNTGIYAVEKLSGVVSRINRLKGARVFLEKQYEVNPLDYI